MNFSICLASRERPQLLTNLVESIKNTTFDLSNVEVVVGIDDDDQISQEKCRELKEKYSFFKFFSRPRSNNLNRDYINAAYHFYSEKGDYAIACNDDVVFLTPNWDKIGLERLNSYLSDKPDGIVYAFVSDSLIQREAGNYTCFPVVSKKAIEVLDFIVTNETNSWDADVHIFRIFNSVKRILDLSEVHLHHHSYHSKTRERDHISHHVQRIHNPGQYVPFEKYIGMLNAAIKKGNLMLELTRQKYQETINYHVATKYDAKLNFIWRDNLPDIANIFDTSKTAEELVNRVDQTFMYAIQFAPELSLNSGVWKDPNDKPHIREKHIDWLLKRLTFDISSLPEHVQESKFIHHRNKVTRNGRVLSGNFLRTLSISQQIFKFIGKVKNVLELGAGCGHQARTYLLQVPDAKYTIVDLPETLIFSFTHLSLCFPEKKLLWVTSEEDVQRIDEFDIVFVPAVFAPRLYNRTYDLFVNTASMGEMNNESIHKWMDFIQNKVTVNNLFTMNRFLNTVDENHAATRKNENECSTTYDHKWKILQWEVEPLYARSPYIDTLHSRYVEIIASRPDSDENYKERSQMFLQDILDQDWVRLEGMFGNGVMQSRNNVLVNDMTMSGTVYKLWESIRLDQNLQNVDLMIKYLDRITTGSGSYFFEEKMYYEGLLNRLKNS